MLTLAGVVVCYRILAGTRLLSCGVQVNVWDLTVSTLDLIVSAKRENLATGEACLWQDHKLSEEEGWWYDI